MHKRVPGGSSSELTRTKRLATIGRTWDFASKQPRAFGESIMPSVMGRNAALQDVIRTTVGTVSNSGGGGGMEVVYPAM